jgi:putative transposase
MLKNHKLARQIADAGWGTLIQFCQYKANWNAKTVLQIGRFTKSSGVPDCGWIKRDLQLSDRVWTCEQCGQVYDRDIQAAKVIKQRALHPENLVRRDAPEFTLAEIGVG